MSTYDPFTPSTYRPYNPDVVVIPRPTPKSWQEDTDRWNNVMHGNATRFNIIAPNRKDTVVKGWRGNDHIINATGNKMNHGNDLFDGGKGYDKVYYKGDASEYKIINNKDGSKYVIHEGRLEIDKLINIEEIVFSKAKNLINKVTQDIRGILRKEREEDAKREA